eukprot:gene11970-25072_t
MCAVNDVRLPSRLIYVGVCMSSPLHRYGENSNSNKQTNISRLLKFSSSQLLAFVVNQYLLLAAQIILIIEKIIKNLTLSSNIIFFWAHNRQTRSNQIFKLVKYLILSTSADMIPEGEVPLNEVQLVALEKMRSSFSHSDGHGMEVNDNMFIRYLRARNFDFEKSSTMLNATLQWRKEYGVGNMESWRDMLTLENSTGKMYVRGFDRQGHSIIYMKPALENTQDYEGNVKHLVFTMEKAVSTMQSLPPEQSKVLLLIDFDGYSMLKASPMKTSMECLHILQNHYPERLFRAYLLRPPWIFHTFYNIIQPFIDPVTKIKIQMIGGTPQEVCKTLQKQIDPDAFESAIGGNDSRPFVSEKYLKGPMNLDYNAILREELSK